jgi:hypothetical protein
VQERLVRVTRFTGGTLAVTATLISVTLLDAEYGNAFAGGKLDARYSVTLAGLSIGSGSWVINIREDEFSAVANGTTAGLGRVFASGQGYSSVHGMVTAGQLAPAVYTTSIRTGQEEYEVRLVFSGANVTDFGATAQHAQSRSHSAHRDRSARSIRSDDRLAGVGARQW